MVVARQKKNNIKQPSNDVWSGGAPAARGERRAASRTGGAETWVVAWAQSGEVAYTTPENSALVCDPLANCQEAAGGSEITLTEVPVRVYLQ